MTNKIFLLVILIVLGINGCSQLIPGSPPVSATAGIEGYVTIGPMCPGPQPIGLPDCQDQPYQATIIILDSNNKKITQLQTDTSGYFKVALNPGTYILRPRSGKPFPIAADQTVSVVDGEYTQVSITYDTGMR